MFVDARACTDVLAAVQVWGIPTSPLQVVPRPGGMGPPGMNGMSPQLLSAQFTAWAGMGSMPR